MRSNHAIIFQSNKPRLSAIAVRILGSVADAEDAVQEAWTKFLTQPVSSIENPEGWLTTVVARNAISMIRKRHGRREDTEDAAATIATDVRDPEAELMLAEAIDLALQVVLQRLSSAERIAFVLHDLFSASFEEIAHIMQRSPQAARQLASRARKKVQGREVSSQAARNVELVEAFHAAARNGDVASLVELLAPDVELVLDKSITPDGQARVIRGALIVARSALAGAAGGLASAVLLINGQPGIAILQGHEPSRLMLFSVADARIVQIGITGDAQAVATYRLAMLPE